MLVHEIFIFVIFKGWKPSTFLSSRESKAGPVNQMPEDYMDEEVMF